MCVREKIGCMKDKKKKKIEAIVCSFEKNVLKKK